MNQKNESEDRNKRIPIPEDHNYWKAEAAKCWVIYNNRMRIIQQGVQSILDRYGVRSPEYELAVVGAFALAEKARDLLNASLRSVEVCVFPEYGLWMDYVIDRILENGAARASEKHSNGVHQEVSTQGETPYDSTN